MPGITGGLPSSWASNMTQLQRLELANLSLSGPMPSLSGLENLMHLALRHMPQLMLPKTGLAAANDTLEALLLENVGGLAGLALDPNLPFAYPDLKLLGLIQLNLSGSVPASWQAFEQGQLQQLLLAGNALNGSLPDWLAALMAPGAELDLSSNRFTGAPLKVARVVAAFRDQHVRTHAAPPTLHTGCMRQCLHYWHLFGHPRVECEFWVRTGWVACTRGHAGSTLSILNL